jgi:NADH-quinone oxidoreductase subunit N
MMFLDRFNNDRKALMPELYIVAIISIVRIYGAYITTYTTNPKTGIHVSYIMVLATIMAALMSFNSIQRHAMLMDDTLLNGALVSGVSSDIIKFMLLLFTGAVLVSIVTVSIRDGRTAFEYPLLVSLSTRGLMFIVSANDIITLYLALEWQSRCMYVLASFKRGSGYSVESGIKYFVLGSVASGSIILGITILYGGLGIVNFTDITRYLMYAVENNSTSVLSNPLVNIGWLLLLSGRLFKVAAVPFHMWVADVYEGAPISSVVYFAVVPKLALVYVLLKLVQGPFYGLMGLTSDYMYLSGMLSLVIGTLGARGQSRIKRFRAYSSIGNIGYMLIGLSMFTYDGYQATLIYIVMYTIMSLAIWLMVSSVVVYTNDGTQLVTKPMVIMSDLTGRVYKSPLIAYAISMVMLSIAGIPPLAGFVSKLMVITAIVNSGWYVSTVFVLLVSCVSAYYYLHIIKIICFDKDVNGNSTVELDVSRAAIIGLSTMTLYLPIIRPKLMLVASYNMLVSIW